MALTPNQVITIRQNLILAAAALDKHSAEDYRRFMQCLSGYAEVFNMKLLKAAPGDILNQQGAADALFTLCEMLLTARQQAASMTTPTPQPAPKGKP